MDNIIGSFAEDFLRRRSLITLHRGPHGPSQAGDVHVPTKVLVAYAIAQGSTTDIARFIGAALAAAGADVETASVTDNPDPTDTDAIVLGSAIHNGEFLPEFRDYVQRYEAELRRRPVWLFSVGMGPALRGPIGAIFKPMVPKPIAATRDALHAIEYHPFAGVFAGLRNCACGLSFG